MVSPIVRFIRKATFQVDVAWNDGNCQCGCEKQRLLRWKFFVNGILRITTAWGDTSATLPIGSGGTYSILPATDAQITDFLIDYGLTIEETDIITIVVEARNCKGDESSSNPIQITPDIPDSNCACEFEFEYDNEQTGDEATTSLDSAGLLVFRNGAINYEKLDFSANEIVEGDELTFVNITGCDGQIETDFYEGAVGNIEIPVVSTLPLSKILLWRNGVMQHGFTKSGNFVVPATPSEEDDQWMFAILESDDGCTFNRFLISNNVTGATFQNLIGFTSANQQDWLLFRNGLLMTPGVHYTINGTGLITLNVPAIGEQFFLVSIN